MNRIELQRILRSVEPALSGKEFVPIFTCFCFDAEAGTVTAYDDAVAMVAPCAGLGLTGGVRGKLLQQFLNASSAVDAEFAVDGQQLTVKCGRARLATSILSPDDFLFQVPEAGGIRLDVTPELVKALACAAVSVGRDPAHPWTLGVTLTFQNDGVMLRSTDNLSATQVFAPTAVKAKAVGNTIVLPPRFVELITGRTPPATLVVSSKFAAAQWDAVTLYTKLVSEHSVENYQQIFVRAEDPALTRVAWPKGLPGSLERAGVVLDTEKDKRVNLTVADGVLTVHAKGGHGEVTERHKLPGHADVAAAVTLPFLTRALKDYPLFCIAPGFVLLTTEDAAGMHLMSARCQ
jgi:DNA polymerase III sliding clamp (beta) subunit (PCNA family)